LLLVRDEELAGTLAAGAAGLGLRLPSDAVERLLAFLAELHRWNRAYNLVADASPLTWLRAHVLDSLSVAPLLRDLVREYHRISGPVVATDRPAGPRRVLDLGTGAGLPGLPLAIALPELRFVLLDSNGKKVRFCRHAVAALGLANVEVVQGRAEGYTPVLPFDAAVARAVGSLVRVRTLVRPFCPGPILVMKGRRPTSELAALGETACETVPLRVPGLDAERQLVILR